MDLRKTLVVEPGTRVRLKDVDAAFHGDYASGEHAKEDLAKNVTRLAELQQNALRREEARPPRGAAGHRRRRARTAPAGT